MRSMITSNDFSGPGIQGRKFISYPEYWKSFSQQFKVWGSQEASDALQASIRSHKNFLRTRTKAGKLQPSIADRAELDLTNFGTNREEKFRSRFAEKYIPGVLRSERAYVGFLNKLRADMFNRFVREASAEFPDILTNDVQLKRLGSFINDATGRGSLGRWERNAKGLNDMFFAPKLQAGRIRYWGRVLNPKFYVNAPKVERKAALRSLISTTSFGLGIGELGRMAGAEVNLDPTSSDFGKVVIGGRVRVDPFGGDQQYFVAVARFLMGKTTSSTSGRTTALRENVVPYIGPEIDADRDAGEYGAQSIGGILANFAANRLAPIPSMAVSIFFNKYFPGGSVETLTGIEDPVLNELADKVVPIMVQDILELVQEDPSLLPLAVPAAFGLTNIQTYGK